VPALKPRPADGRLVACHVAQGEVSPGTGLPNLARAA
jgi:peptide/nickel transport system ATP-binding protein